MFDVTEEAMIAEVDAAWRALKRKITRSSQISEEDRQIVAAIRSVLKSYAPPVP